MSCDGEIESEKMLFTIWFGVDSSSVVIERQRAMAASGCRGLYMVFGVEREVGGQLGGQTSCHY